MPEGIEDLLDQCLEALRRGETFEECLGRYPEHAKELEPLLLIAQAVIATPIIAAVSAAALMALPPRLRLQMRAMGANDAQYLWLLAREARLSLLIAIIAGFGAVVSEVGASMMVGGNIAGETRLLTTAAVVEVSRGNFGTALAFGFILLGLIVAVSVVLSTVQQRARRT